MARGRMLMKSISCSEKLRKLPNNDSRLLYTWIIPHCDREGNFHANEDLIKGMVVPLLKEFNAEKNIPNHIIAMERVELITVHEVGGALFLHIVNFDTMQIRLDKDEKLQFPSLNDKNKISYEFRRNSDGKQTESVINLIELNITEPNIQSNEKIKNTPATKNPVAVWCEIYEEIHKVKYTITKKDAGILVRLGKHEKYERLVRLFHTTDNFAKSYSTNIFNTKFNDLIRLLGSNSGINSAAPPIKRG